MIKLAHLMANLTSQAFQVLDSQELELVAIHMLSLEIPTVVSRVKTAATVSKAIVLEETSSLIRPFLSSLPVCSVEVELIQWDRNSILHGLQI